MDIQDFKRWHWIVISVIVGLILGKVWSSVEPDIPRSIGQSTFEQNLLGPPVAGNPRLAKLTVHPPIENIYVVTGEQPTDPDNPNVKVYKPFSFRAENPYPTMQGTRKLAGDPNETVLSYLKKMSQAHSNV